jgi:hypothetical protein
MFDIVQLYPSFIQWQILKRHFVLLLEFYLKKEGSPAAEIYRQTVNFRQQKVPINSSYTSLKG